MEENNIKLEYKKKIFTIIETLTIVNYFLSVIVYGFLNNSFTNYYFKISITILIIYTIAYIFIRLNINKQIKINNKKIEIENNLKQQEEEKIKNVIKKCQYCGCKIENDICKNCGAKK